MCESRNETKKKRGNSGRKIKRKERKRGRSEKVFESKVVESRLIESGAPNAFFLPIL